MAISPEEIPLEFLKVIPYITSREGEIGALSSLASSLRTIPAEISEARRQRASRLLEEELRKRQQQLFPLELRAKQLEIERAREEEKRAKAKFPQEIEKIKADTEATKQNIAMAQEALELQKSSAKSSGEANRIDQLIKQGSNIQSDINTIGNLLTTNPTNPDLLKKMGELQAEADAYNKAISEVLGIPRSAGQLTQPLSSSFTTPSSALPPTDQISSIADTAMNRKIEDSRLPDALTQQVVSILPSEYQDVNLVDQLRALFTQSVQLVGREKTRRIVQAQIEAIIRDVGKGRDPADIAADIQRNRENLARAVQQPSLLSRAFELMFGQ